MNYRNIVLAGFMAAGKTEIGKSLAENIGKPFTDLDTYIENQTGNRIPEIFEQKGEKHFRMLEQKYLDDLLTLEQRIISLGGGALHNESVVKKIKDLSLLVFINTPFSTILDRLYNDSTRPLLKDKNGNKKSINRLEKDLRKLYTQRLPVYKKAHIQFSPDVSKSVVDNAKELTAIINNL